MLACLLTCLCTGSLGVQTGALLKPLPAAQLRQMLAVGMSRDDIIAQAQAGGVAITAAEVAQKKASIMLVSVDPRLVRPREELAWCQGIEDCEFQCLFSGHAKVRHAAHVWRKWSQACCCARAMHDGDGETLAAGDGRARDPGILYKFVLLVSDLHP